MMGNAIKQGGGHFGVNKDLYPFSERQIGGNDEGGFLVKCANWRNAFCLRRQQG